MSYKLTRLYKGDPVASSGGYAFRKLSRTAEEEETTEGTQGLAYTLSDDGTYYSCSGIGTATDTDIVIASEIDGIPVTSIGRLAFYSCKNLTSIVIPDSVTSIGDGAFADCDSLASIDIPDSVTKVGNEAFCGCDNLASVVIPDSVTSIGRLAFAGCDSLASIDIGDSVTSIGNWAFADCDSLTSIVIGDSVTSIGESAFSWCNSLTNVYYKGTAEEWANIAIGESNEYLTNATIHYNYTG